METKTKRKKNGNGNGNGNENRHVLPDDTAYGRSPTVHVDN